MSGRVGSWMEGVVEGRKGTGLWRVGVSEVNR